MDKTMPFGLTYFNGHAIIKINAKLNDTQLARLQKDLPNAWIAPTCKGRTRIEACVPSKQADKTLAKIKLAILRTKRDALQEEIMQTIDRKNGYALAG